jgi:hypothetical protein
LRTIHFAPIQLHVSVLFVHPHNNQQNAPRKCATKKAEEKKDIALGVNKTAKMKKLAAKKAAKKADILDFFFFLCTLFNTDHLPPFRFLCIERMPESNQGLLRFRH